MTDDGELKKRSFSADFIQGKHFARHDKFVSVRDIDEAKKDLWDESDTIFYSTSLTELAEECIVIPLKTFKHWFGESSQ